MRLVANGIPDRTDIGSQPVAGVVVISLYFLARRYSLFAVVGSLRIALWPIMGIEKQ